LSKSTCLRIIKVSNLATAENVFDELVELFKSANEKFEKEEKDLLESDVKENCLCASLANYIRDSIKGSEFCNYYVDVEYNRNRGKTKKIDSFSGDEPTNIVCDLIVHSRAKSDYDNKKYSYGDNLLALEMKKDYRSPEEKQKDRERLMQLTMMDGNESSKNVRGYKVGIYYELDSMGHPKIIDYYANGALV